MKISACIIVKNEEQVIARCLESYHMAVDEIIVVDTGSTDQTVDIAKRFGAKLFHFTWIDDFSAAKNYAIAQAKGDWIVFLDADEYFANGTGSNIRAYLKKLDPTFNSVACKMVNIDQVSGRVLDEITHVRIFKNDKQIRYVNTVHEMLQNTQKNKKMNAILARPQEFLIYHTGYSHDNRQEKAQRNLDILLRELPRVATQTQAMYYHYIADCYFGLEEWEKVIEYTQLFLSSGAKFVGYNVRPHNNLIDAMMQLKYPSSEILQKIDIAIETFPKHPVFRFYKGKILYDLKQYDAAFREQQAALLLHKEYQDIEINSLALNLETVYFILGAISEYRSDCGAAIEYYLEALKIDKHNAECFDRLLKLIRNQAVQEIILFLNTLYDSENEADLDFLLTRLVNHAAPKVLAYYTNLREKRYPKQDLLVLQMLVANKYYDKAFPALLDYYMKDGDERLAIVAATAALLSGNELYIDRCLEVLPLPITQIIKSYLGKNFELADDGIAAFLSLVNVFILWADQISLERLLALEDHFPDYMTAKVGSVFIKEGYYQTGMLFYDLAMKKAAAAGSWIDPVLYYNRGYCLHRMKEHTAAVQAFIQAYEWGYRANDLFEFLRWNIHNERDKNKVKITLGEDWQFVQQPEQILQ